MKKISLFIAAIVGFTLSLQAQETDGLDNREKFTLGLRAGANLSNVWDSEGQDFDADPKLGFAGGLFVAIPIGKYMGVQPEILISQKGFKASGTLLGTPYSYKKTTNYIDIPLQFQLKPSPYVTVLVGPQFSFLISEKNEYTFGNNSSAQQQEFDNDNIRKNILGVITGIDINIYHVVVSGRVCWDLQNNKGDGTSTTPRYRNQFVQLTVGFKI